uniref:(+)-delta-cadinene synthase isozyme XC14 n=1 Tax=Cajanus cajan TaxID=3821 RepID=A0A151QMR9_CAJCA|nr:(+)-delta-cadinene synthase isozyme XC14 [Cajanus cajan]
MLKEDVRMMFQASVNQNIIDKLNLIDLIQRFGVSYQFQQEINQALKQINDSFNEDENHHSLALLFRLLRQQGYQISSSIFNKLKNDQGNFDETLVNDIQGLCNLYEATHLRTHEDDILEEARPLNKSVLRFEARYHMTIYEQDPFHDETLLTFAKVDFNILQKIHQKEIGNINKWWRKSNFAIKVPYARDRLVEAYLWSLATSSNKLEYSYIRMFMGKLTAVVALLDDTYDDYGTIQELELFTKAIERWDINPFGCLPQCMRVVFDTVVEFCEEIKLKTTKTGKSSFVMPHFKQAIYNLIKGYMVEAKWCHESYVPTYDEYKVNGVLSSTIPFFITSFICIGEFATENVLDWASRGPNIIEAASIIGRVVDDMASHKFEQQRVHVASAVECCMKQYDISQADAYKLIHKDVEDCWKVINKEYLNLNDIPEPVLDFILNLTRMCEVSYENHQDRFTNGELLKEYVSSLLVDPMCINQHR